MLKDRRFGVNTAAVFGSILFYTKFFAYFGILKIVGMDVCWDFRYRDSIGILEV